MNIPKRNDPSEFKCETFEDYYARFPNQLSHIPEDVVRTWFWFHNEQVIGFSKLYHFRKWTFTLEKFDNSNIMEIRHFEYDLKRLDGKGAEFIKGKMKGYDTADFMFENGTSPCPMNVAKNAGEHIHQQRFEGEEMLQPYHLIEGNRRLAFLRAMIKYKFSRLKDSHDVWVVNIEA